MKFLWTMAKVGFHLKLQALQLRDLGFAGYLQWHRVLMDAWRKERSNRSEYQVLSEAESKATRKSDTVFVFGSGYSLNDISHDEWRHFEAHDTFGFSGFIYEKWVRVDYHLIRGWVEVKAGMFNWRAHTQQFADILNANVLFRDTILILQGEYLAQFCNALIGYGYLRPGTRLFRYATARGTKTPTRRLGDGLCHTVGTLSDAVNFAYCLGWKNIVLVGVDLYDSRYFWLKSNETLNVDDVTGALIPAEISIRGRRFDQAHNTARNGVVQSMGEWRLVLERNGVRLSVYNPQSLLADVLPVYANPCVQSTTG